MLLYYYRKGVITIKRSSKIISISVKKAYITGLILSLIFAIACAYLISYLITDSGFSNDTITTFRLTVILLPIIFIAFFILIIGFIVMCSSNGKKHK